MKRVNPPTRQVCLVCLFCVSLVFAAHSQTFQTLSTLTGANGAVPTDTLVLGSDGNLYGTTQYGGAANEGTIFRMTPSGTLKTLYSFCSKSNCVDGSTPVGGLVQGADGNYYGAALGGGAFGEGKY